MSFDPESVMVASIPLLAVIFGLTEFAKDIFGLTGNKVRLFAASVGGVLFLLYQVSALLPPFWSQVYTIVIMSVTFGLTCGGWYRFANARLPKQGTLTSYEISAYVPEEKQEL